LRELNYKFTGYQNYDPVQEKLRSIFRKAFMARNAYFNIAVDEAVVNAARYAVKGLADAEIAVQVRLMENAIEVKVSSNTNPFNAKAYQMQLRELANDPKYTSMDWGDYTGTSTMSRGFWYMLQAVDYLTVAEDGSYVSLSAKIPFQEKRLDTSIGFLVPKFLVDSGGVIG